MGVYKEDFVFYVLLRFLNTFIVQEDDREMRNNFYIDKLYFLLHWNIYIQLAHCRCHVATGNCDGGPVG